MEEVVALELPSTSVWDEMLKTFPFTGTAR
jgi:hypothetical protein